MTKHEKTELPYDLSQEPDAFLADQTDIRVFAEFIPFSMSRNASKGPKVQDMSLNWRVTLRVRDRDVLETDYSAGIGHCPGYSAAAMVRGFPMSSAAVIQAECETGIPHKFFDNANGIDVRPLRHKKPLMPKAADVIHSLLMDADAIEHDSFESWAGDLGFDTDSRKAESIYRACLEIDLKLRNALGDTELEELREAFQDY